MAIQGTVELYYENTYCSKYKIQKEETQIVVLSHRNDAGQCTWQEDDLLLTRIGPWLFWVVRCDSIVSECDSLKSGN